MLVDVMINDRNFNAKYDCEFDGHIRIYRKMRFIKPGNIFMKLDGKIVTFVVYRTTINTVLKTISRFSIRDFQYNLELMENCPSLLLNKLKPFSCVLLSKEPIGKGVCLITMFLCEITSKSHRIKPLVRILGTKTCNNRQYNYWHLLFVPRFYSIEDIENVKYNNRVAIINFEGTYVEEEHELCAKLFPGLMFIDGDNSVERISYAYKEIMNMYSNPTGELANSTRLVR